MSAVRDLMHHYQHVIDELVVVTGKNGVFDVEVDGTVLYSKRASGRHAEPGEVLELFRTHIGRDVPEYER